MIDKEKKYKSEIAKILQCDPENLFLYWKGRVALYAALRAIGIKENDEIILPAFTCVVVPNAIIYLKAKPVYVEINPENYNSYFDQIEQRITKRTRIIISQNTFGLSSDIEKIVELAKKYNLITIEDCTHGFGGFYNGKPNGSYCDFAFYSTQWNKPFSTGIGGFLLVNNKNYLTKLVQIEKEKIKPSLKEKVVLFFLLIFNKYFLNEFSYWTLVRLYRFLSSHNLIIGSNQGYELTSTKIPSGYFKDISIIQVNMGIKSLRNFNTTNLLRRKNALVYSNFLKENNKTFVEEKFFNNHLFLKYPIITLDREKFLERAEQEKIILGDWFLSPLHPIKEGFEKWDFNCNDFPIADSVSKKIVNLPTENKDNMKVINFLKNNLDLIQ